MEPTEMNILVVDSHRWSQGRIAQGIARYSEAVVMDQQELRSYSYRRDLSNDCICEFPWYEASYRLKEKCKRFTVVMGSHGIDYDWPDKSDWRSRIATANRNRTNAARLQKPAAVVCLSRQLVESVKPFTPNPELCYPGVDTDLFKPLSKPSSDTIKIGWCGQRGGLTKGFEEIWRPLVEVIRRNRKDVDFVSNTRTAQDALDVYEMASWYNKLDLLVSTSCSEGFQTTILEAMACGVPVLMTNVGGAADAVSQGGGVLVGSYYNEETAARTIEDLWMALSNETKETLANRGVSARHTAENWSWKHLSQRWIDVIGTEALCTTDNS